MRASVLAVFLLIGVTCIANERTISQTELRAKIAGFWMGQIAGNYLGYPFESLYNERTGVMSYDIDRYLSCYTDRDLIEKEYKGIKMHCNDRRGYTDIFARRITDDFIIASC